MHLINRLPEILEAGKRDFNQFYQGDGTNDLKEQAGDKTNRNSDFREVEAFGKGDSILGLGDNLAFISHLLSQEAMGGKVQMIYVDPPFFSKASYQATVSIEDKGNKALNIKVPAYKDLWAGSLEKYLTYLCGRFMAMYQLLSDTGLLWVHLDWHAVHYAKVLLDEIFGVENFVNEIIWSYKSGGSSSRHFSRKHDTILLYGKTKDYRLTPGKEKSYNRNMAPYRFKGVKEYQDDLGWYTLVNRKDVWPIDMVGRTSGERTGYATQKPEALLTRIIETTTVEGDICGDFFSGSGSLVATANNMNRRFIGCDQEPLAMAMTEKRVLGSSYRLLWESRKGEPHDKTNMVLSLEERNRISDILTRNPQALTYYETERRKVDVFGNTEYFKD